MIMKHLILITAMAWGTSLRAQDKIDVPREATAIRAVLAQQVRDWNSFNIEGFMQGYWKSDSMMFVSSKITYGWDSTLARYKRSYPNATAMGELRFEIIKLQFISKDACLVTGNYFLKRKLDNPSGTYTLLFRKKKEKWVVVYDHTS